MPPAPRRPPQIALIFGNDEARVGEERYALERAHLPEGQESGEVVDIRPPGNAPLLLARCVDQIIGELGMVSLIPGLKRVVVVHDLSDFKAPKGGAKKSASKKSAKADTKRDDAERLEEYLARVLPTTENALIFVYNEDEDKDRWVGKSSRVYDIAARLGTLIECREKRTDWQLEDLLSNRDLNGSIALLREWLERSSSIQSKVLRTLNDFLQLLLQARLKIEAEQQGLKTRGLFPTEMRPSLESVPSFKFQKYMQLAKSIPLPRIHRALTLLNDAQRNFYPHPDMRVAHDAGEMLEQMLVELFQFPPRGEDQN